MSTKILQENGDVLLQENNDALLQELNVYPILSPAAELRSLR